MPELDLHGVPKAIGPDGQPNVRAPRMIPDRCSVCGRFVGWYPVGFYCDTHCARCVCTRCPGFRIPPR